MFKNDHFHARGVALNMWLKVVVVEHWMHGGIRSKFFDMVF